MKNFLFVFGLFLSFSVFSQAEKEQSMLWKVSGGDLSGTSYFIGTLPVQDSSFFRFPDKLTNYMSKTGVLLYLPETPLTGSAKVFRENSFGALNKDYRITPNVYLKQLAETQLKPVVSLDEAWNYNAAMQDKAFADEAINPAKQRKLLDDLSFNYFSGKYLAAAEQRLQLDVPQSVYQELVSKNNYLILNKMVEQMRLQPIFFPVDMIHLGGNEGLITLLRARGYNVKPVDRKFYLSNEDALIALRNMQNPTPQPQNNPVTTPSVGEPTQSVNVPAVKPSALSLPMEILNLSQWSNYTVEDSLIQLTAPGRLRLTNETEQSKTYENKSNGLTYTISVAPSVGGNLSAATNQIVIRSGGQVVHTENKGLNGINGRYVELMYLENQVSRHYLLPAVGKLYNVSVRGEAPQIFSVVADKFFNSIQFTSVVASPTLVSDVPPAPEAVLWHSFESGNMNISFPKEPEKKSQKLENGTEVTTYSVTELINGNKYLLAVNSKDAFDNFQLFNSSINTATTHLKGVIVRQNVMPEGFNNYAEYVVKDPVGSYYRISYYYDGSTFYQVIIKGTKKTINNADANRVLSSVLFNQMNP